MSNDFSNGYEGVASKFAAARSASSIGVEVLREWVRALPRDGNVVDIGCGSGEPVTAVLVESGLAVFAIDASQTLVAACKKRFPDVDVACEAAEHSQFFDRTFDGAVAIGLMFLLPENVQAELVLRVAHVLEPGGRFLFSAPREICTWNDVLTGQRSQSLGADEYSRILDHAGLRLINCHVDEGKNHYYDAIRPLG